MKKRLISTITLIAYSAILIKVMVFKDMPTIRIGQLMLNFAGTDAGHSPNFVPFKTILPYLLGYKGLIIAGVNLVGNVALLVPIGFLVPLVYRNMTWKKSIALAVAAGLSFEVMQTVLRVGIFDIDDVILNALGVMIGYWAFAILAKWVRSRNYKNIIITR
jgi:glycopeptide antibiotics resistance protein